MFHYFYKIVNLINNKFYYGIHSTKNLYDSYFGSGTNLKRAIEKYGIENFEMQILAFRNTREEISDLEEQIVDEILIKDPNCYNIRLGGDRGTTSGSATMKDVNGNVYQVIIGSDEYKNMIGATTGMMGVYDKIEKRNKQITSYEYQNNKDRYDTFTKGMASVYDKVEERTKQITLQEFQNNKDRYVGCTFGKVKVLKDGVYELISIEEYKKGNYKTVWSGRRHTEETKLKMSLTKKETKSQMGEKNSQYGTCWICKDGINKKINKKDLEFYYNNGWSKGRYVDKTQTSKLNVNSIIEDIKQGLTNKEIIEKYKVGLTTLSTFMRNNNIKHRDIK